LLNSKEENWEKANCLPYYFQFEERESILLSRIIPNISMEALDLLESLLQLNPCKRPSTTQILEHSFFKDIELKPSQDFVKSIQTFKHPEVIV